ncbi:MAG: hypothetical protein HKN44_04380 [Ilumatobacter sp.]|nr:hypothetical protein [Ilumatobacter sp.]
MLILVNRDDDGGDVLGSVPPTVDSSTPDVGAPPASDPPTVTTVESTVPPTEPATTVPGTEPATTPAPTTAPPTTAPPATTTQPAPPPTPPSGWQRATGTFPDLAFIACCGSNWVGEPSPAVPADAGAPLAPGIYNLRAEFVDEPDVFSDGVIRLEIRPYVRCGELAGAGFCEGEAPFPDNELGVPSDPARVLDLALDDAVRVALSGFACGATELSIDQQVAAGSDLTRFAAELDAAYEAAIGSQLRAGTTPEQIVADLTAAPAAGFSDPGCPDWTELMWTPSGGPGVKADGIFRLDSASNVLALRSASASWVRPTALAVDDAGGFTVYFYAAFLS